MKHFYILVLVCAILLPFHSVSQVTNPNQGENYFIIHSSGNVVGEGADSKSVIQTYTGGGSQSLQFIPDGTGYYSIKIAGQQKYMALQGDWNTYFENNNSTDNSKYAIEQVSPTYITLRCKANNLYLGTDNITNNSSIFSDKSGTVSNHYWYISQTYILPPEEMIEYNINPSYTYDKAFEGWGVSLCWWANMCGRWDDDKIDEIVDWLVSPEGLNYNIFRYNIGGGDDPLHRNCDPGHMASGKGIRAEMEGFKDGTNSLYNWSRDAAQRKIMLKIKEKRPDAIFEAFSNSAPYYMTYSGCVAGHTSSTSDNLRPEYYEEFANYLVDVCKHYRDEYDIEFRTLEPFNEPVSDYWRANGGQEGCHFSRSAQVNFMQVLHPILQASGLNTVISTADETSVAKTIETFKAYSSANIQHLIGQWNSHSYTDASTNLAKANARALATDMNKTLWMSELGMRGDGISGNLQLAQRLMHDIRYMRAEAWVDWQYVEENNNQWCTVQGDFEAQTYGRVKNYYVRQQLSRYLKIGSKFLYAPNEQMLAALNSTEDTLVVVVMNNTTSAVHYKMLLAEFSSVSNTISCTRTSENEDNATAYDFGLNDTTLTITLPRRSITTLVIPVQVEHVALELKTDIPYAILTRSANLSIIIFEIAACLNFFLIYFRIARS